MSDEQQTGAITRRIMWQRLDTPGMEISIYQCEPRRARAHDANLLFAEVMVALDGAPSKYMYFVYCDAAWNTTILNIYGDERELALRVEDGRWLGREQAHNESQLPWRELSELAGCVDVDLGISPSTNTLPIRRLNLAVGESRELTAAWVRFPELTVEPLAQRYTRLAERRYRYESVVSGFTAELEVDDLGLVVSYEGIWQRVAESKQN
jgi:hypothetical protein